MRRVICDVCGVPAGDLFKMARIREVTFADEYGKKQKIDLCQECWQQIREISRKVRAEKCQR